MDTIIGREALPKRMSARLVSLTQSLVQEFHQRELIVKADIPYFHLSVLTHCASIYD